MSDRRAKESQPARQTRAASSRRRQSWSGWGERDATEKDAVGVFLDDVAYAFADVSTPSIPILYYLLVTEGAEYFGAKAAAMVAWLTIVVGAALIRGGWLKPLATDVPGWVALSPWLVALRLVYYNGALALAAYGGAEVGSVWSPLASIAFAFLVGALAVGVFPRLAEEFYGYVSG